jgi:hypothetical protein
MSKKGADDTISVGPGEKKVRIIIFI